MVPGSANIRIRCFISGSAITSCIRPPYHSPSNFLLQPLLAWWWLPSKSPRNMLIGSTSLGAQIHPLSLGCHAVVLCILFRTSLSSKQLIFGYTDSRRCQSIYECMLDFQSSLGAMSGYFWVSIPRVARHCTTQLLHVFTSHPSSHFISQLSHTHPPSSPFPFWPP